MELERQLQAYARHLVDEAEQPPRIESGFASPRRPARGPALILLSCLLLVLGGATAMLLTQWDHTEVATLDSSSPDTDNSDESDIAFHRVSQEEISAAIEAAPPGLPSSLAQIGADRAEVLSTSDGPVEIVVSRLVGEGRTADGFCANGVCYGSGFGTDLEAVHLMGGQTLPDGTRALVLWVPWDTTSLRIAWDDGTESTAETTQPFGPRTPRLAAVRAPAGVASGLALDGRSEKRLDLPPFPTPG